jgi:Transmembrane secretion effector
MPSLLDGVRSSPGRIAAALTHRNFRLLWIGALVSSIGTWMQRVAQSWLDCRDDGIQFGILPGVG